MSTLGARDVSSAVSGSVDQVFIVTRAKSFAARGFGLRLKICLRPTPKIPARGAREKPLVRRVIYESLAIQFEACCIAICLHRSFEKKLCRSRISFLLSCLRVSKRALSRKGQLCRLASPTIFHLPLIPGSQTSFSSQPSKFWMI